MTKKEANLPKGIIANTLNMPERRIDRGHRKDGGIPRLHVSSLIKSSPSDFFCEREFVLKYMEDRSPKRGGIPPKFGLLYAVGHFYGDYIVNEFLRRNPRYAKHAWGDWRCRCGEVHLTRKLYPGTERKCKKCGTPPTTYLETDLFNPSKTVVGHADLILYYRGVFYVYEFKSIERADVDFDTLEDPLGDHLVQASNYFHMLLAEGKKVAVEVRFVYVDRSMKGLYTQKPFKELEGRAVPYTRLKPFYDKAKKVHLSIEKGRLPRRKCESITCARAKQCPVAISCFNRTSTKIRKVQDTQSD